MLNYLEAARRKAPKARIEGTQIPTKQTLFFSPGEPKTVTTKRT